MASTTPRGRSPAGVPSRVFASAVSQPSLQSGPAPSRPAIFLGVLNPNAGEQVHSLTLAATSPRHANFAATNRSYELIVAASVSERKGDYSPIKPPVLRSTGAESAVWARDGRRS